MITATIGKIFLEAYNKKHDTKYDARTFFVEVYHPLFFDSNKYLQWVQNSPFVQMKKGQKVETLTADERKEKLQDFITKVENSSVPDASNAPGFPASEEKEFATTSGQVTNLNLSTGKDDIFFSWIGSSLGVGLQGRLSILFLEPVILIDLFEGWNLYRKVISENDKLRGNQINTWNGQWLAHRYSKDYRQEQPMADFKPFETANDGMSVATQSWTKVLIGISRQFNNPRMMGYVYNLGQTNTTIGFIPFSLEHIRRPIQLYAKLFDAEEGKKAEDLWGTENGFRACCQRGAIGIEAMQPKGLRQYMTIDKNKEIKLPKYKSNDEIKTINFHTYQIWLLAMLNNEELWTKSMEFAQTLQSHTEKSKNGKTTNSRQIDAVLSATNKKTFIEALTTIASESTDVNGLVEMAKTINQMPNDNVPYLLTLIRFQYAALQQKQ